MEEKTLTKAFTSFEFDTLLGEDGYYTIIATCRQGRAFDGEDWTEVERSVKILDRDANRGNASAYMALLSILQDKGFNLIGEEKPNEETGERYLN